MMKRDPTNSPSMRNYIGRHAFLLALSVLLVACGASQPPALVDSSIPLRANVAELQESREDSARPEDAPELLITGEAILLRALAGARTRFAIRQVRSLYSFNERGQKLSYLESRDWEFRAGRIARVTGSRIPDFDKYRYSTETACGIRALSTACARSWWSCFSGRRVCGHLTAQTQSAATRFEFKSEPRNPPLTINFVVYVDYTTSGSDRVVMKRALLPKDPARVVCLGDSIVAGSHTISRHYFNSDSDSWCGLLRNYLGSGASVVNQSVEGGEIDVSRANLKPLLANQADLVVIAFGMNDHIRGADHLRRFSQDLDDIVAALQRSGAKVLLFGFFQQNPLWVSEDAAQTTAYNRKIAAVAAKYGIPFLDVLSAFDKASPQFEPYYQLTADFMHHPNNYGQRIYFSMLVPYVLK